MVAGELLALFRSEMGDIAAPYLWSDSEVYSYIDDAQKMFCRLTEGIADATTPAVTALSVVPGSGYLALHPSIKLIRSATRADNGRPVDVQNFENMERLGWRFDGRTGPVRGLIIGEQEDKVRPYPTPSETVQIKLMVFRLPLYTIEGDDDLEIPEPHHRHLLLWAKSLAYLKHDSEAFDKVRSEGHEVRFRAYCKDTLVEQRRKRHKSRAVAYGGL